MLVQESHVDLPTAVDGEGVMRIYANPSDPAD
jgi:hypothetical protein